MAAHTSTQVKPRYRAAGSRTSRVRFVVMVFLCVLAFLTYFDRVCIASAQGEIQRDLNLSNTQMGLVLGGFWLAYGLFEIPGGWLGDRYGSRRTLSRIVLAWSIFTALSGSAAGFTSLFLYRFMFGAGEAGAFPNMARVQNAWFSMRSQGRVGGVLWLIARWGGALSYVIFPTLIGVLASPKLRNLLATTPGLHLLATMPAWRMAFWVCGTVGLGWVLLFYPWFRDEPAHKRGVNQAELDLIRQGRPAADRQPPSHRGLEVWGALFSSLSLWAIAIAYMCGSFGWSFFVSWMPRYMNGVYHLDPQIQKWMNTGPLLVGGVACLLGGWLSDHLVRLSGRPRLGRVVFPIFGMAVFGGSMFAIQFVHNPWTALWLMCLASFGNDLGQAPAWAAIIGIGGRYAGTAFGFINMTANVGGNFLQPVLGSIIFTRWGWNRLFLIYAAVLAVGSILWFVPDPIRRFYPEPRDARGFDVLAG